MMALSSFFTLIILCEIKLAVSELTGLSKATAQFAFDTLKANGNSTENVFFSPASITACVGMLYAGSEGQTKSQIGKALYNDLDDETIYNQMKDLSITLNAPAASYNLNIANRLYAQNKFHFLKPYLVTLKTNFHSQIIQVDFAKAESVRKDIYNWVQHKTNRKIKDMFPQNSLNEAVLVLVNAIYFKGTWTNKFDEANTFKKKFFTDANTKADIDMMKHFSKDFFYTEDNDVQCLGLPYLGEQLAMFVILPKTRFGMTKVESEMTGDSFQKLIQNASEREVSEVQLPRFKVEKELPLTKIMKSLGMTDMFIADKVDLSGIDGNKDLVVSDAIHKAFIEVNERGTEAAASTGIVVVGASAPVNEPPPVTFIADQPFLFAIVERKSWIPLFLGRFVGNN